MEANDSRLHRLGTALAARPVRDVPRDPGTREAAVALVLRPGDDLELLLIRRAERSGDPWSGHIAFPGGTRQADDASLLATALRETEEETGVSAEERQLLGALDPVRPMTRRLPDIVIAPFVMTVPHGTMARPDGVEVVATMWAPLRALRDERAVGEMLHDAGDARIPFATIEFGGHVIWGLTHRILTTFLGLVSEAER